MKIIKQNVYFDASPHEVFEILMDSKKHAGFTESKANISRSKNGRFEAYDGWIQGKNIEIIKDKKIVQAWRGADWKNGYFSRVEFRFEKKGKGCKLIFVHKGVPEEHLDDIKQGWIDHYWTKMEDYLRNHPK